VAQSQENALGVGSHVSTVLQKGFGVHTVRMEQNDKQVYWLRQMLHDI
jgi:hypothetical protein